MPIRNYPSVTKTRIRVFTVNRDQQQIEGILPDNGKVAVAIWDTPSGFRWPKIDEIWSIQREPGGPWTLGSQVVDVSTLPPDTIKLDADNIVNSTGERLITAEDIPTQVSGDKTFTYDQIASSTTWVIAHGMNKYPSITVVDSAGSVVVGDIHYDSINQVTITFSFPFGGKAYLN